jgi:hypothetical protein
MIHANPVLVLVEREEWIEERDATAVESCLDVSLESKAVRMYSVDGQPGRSAGSQPREGAVQIKVRPALRLYEVYDRPHIACWGAHERELGASDVLPSGANRHDLKCCWASIVVSLASRCNGGMSVPLGNTHSQ